MMKPVGAAAVLALTLSLGACASARDQRIVNGALIGGAGGAVIGGVASGTAGGAVAGGALGAAAGAIVADATRPRYYHRHYRRCYWSYDLGRRVCRY